MNDRQRLLFAKAVLARILAGATDDQKHVCLSAIIDRGDLSGWRCPFKPDCGARKMDDCKLIKLGPRIPTTPRQDRPQ
jgi:hypothetical protein